MIDHHNKCIFIHIPKTGGTSVTRAFGVYEIRHLTKEKIINQLGAIKGNKIWNEYFKFTIVRNPWDRLVSTYCYLKYNNYRTTANEKKYISKFNSFEEWLRGEINRPNKTKLGPIIRAANFYTLSQTQRIQRSPVDKILRFENLNEEFKKLSKEMKWRTQPLTYANSSLRRKNYSEYYNKELLSIMEPLVREDAENFGYTFQKSITWL